MYPVECLEVSLIVYRSVTLHSGPYRSLHGPAFLSLMRINEMRGEEREEERASDYVPLHLKHFQL